MVLPTESHPWKAVRCSSMADTGTRLHGRPKKHDRPTESRCFAKAPTHWSTCGRLKATAFEAAVLTVRLVDAMRRTVPTASALLEVEVRGAGELIGLGSGDPTAHEVDRPRRPDRGSRLAWHGLGRVLIQATGVPGGIVCEVHAPSLRSRATEHIVSE